MRFLGNIEEFNSENESWDSYFERFENWLIINDVPAEKKTRLLLAVIGAKAYSLLKTLSNNEEIVNFEIDKINKLLGEHFNPKPIIVSERYKFWTIRQSSEESINEFSLRIQKLGRSCDFGNFQDEAFRDIFIVGLSDRRQNIQASL